MNSVAEPLLRDVDAGGEETEGPSNALPVIFHYWNIARRRLWLILAILIAALAAGLVMTLLAQPLYTATTRIEIARQQANVTSFEGVQARDMGQNLEFYSTQYDLLKARSLAERVVKDLRLARDPLFVQTFGLDKEEDVLPTNSGFGQLSSAQLKKREARATATLLDGISIAPIRGSALVDIRFASPNPGLSARIADAWASAFIQQSMDRRFASTSDARRFLETRLEGLRERLQQSERALVDYAESQKIVRLSDTQSVDGKTRTTQTLARADVESINAELAKAVADRVAAEARMSASAGNRSSAEGLANPALNNLRSRRADVAGEYAKLLVQFEPEYPAARALKDQLRAIDASIANEERRVGEAVTSVYRAAADREGQLRSRLDSMLSLLSGQDRASIQYNIFQREVDTNRQLYESLLQRYKEIGVSGVATNNISIVDPAVAPGAPSSPRLVLNLALALLVGVGLAGLSVFVLENLDEGIREPAQLSAALQLPILGVIPDSGDLTSVELISDPKSELAEAYMTVRTNLSLTTDHGLPRTLSLTSSAPAEGKSTSSLVLAATIARVGRSVILVDVDLRKPSVWNYLGLRNEGGVSNFLTGQTDWQTWVQKTELKNLSFLAAGPIPPSAADLLSNDRLKQLVSELSQHYDHVILDSPPLLGLSDAPRSSRASSMSLRRSGRQCGRRSSPWLGCDRARHVCSARF